MSYLNSVRLHFAGDFRADVSTVNNIPPHFDNATFTPNDQLSSTDTEDNGLWQPAGTGAWRLAVCRITGFGSADGEHRSDPVVGMTLRDAGDRVSAKLVDLDPEQQLVSTIFGLTLRLVDQQGQVLMQGDFKPAGFWNIWRSRAKAGVRGDIGASSNYQSTLVNVVWGDVSKSPVLSELRTASQPGRLSIKFMLDGYSMQGPRQGYGRIVGTIGPCLDSEPDHFVTGRHLAPTGARLDHVVAKLDRNARCVWVDFGGAIHTATSGGPLADTGSLHLISIGSGGAAADLGTLQPYIARGWYESTAGIQAFPSDRSLTDAELAALENVRLAVSVGPPLSGRVTAAQVLAIEAPDGLYARPDEFVYRLEPGIAQRSRVQVTRFGVPVAGKILTLAVTANGLQKDQGDPDVAVPATAVKPRVTGPTGADGWTEVTLNSEDPGRPRGYIDGQVYAVEVRVEGAAATGPDFEQRCFISVLLFSGVKPIAKPDWDDARPIFIQYANLYPRPHGPDRYAPFSNRPPLHPVVNLGDYDAIAAFAGRIHAALQLPFEHPNHMPVVRDLSAGRRALLIGFLERILAGEDVRGAAPKSALLATAGAGLPQGPALENVDPGLGGKTATMARTIGQPRGGPGTPVSGDSQ